MRSLSGDSPLVSDCSMFKLLVALFSALGLDEGGERTPPLLWATPPADRGILLPDVGCLPPDLGPLGEVRLESLAEIRNSISFSSSCVGGLILEMSKLRAKPSLLIDRSSGPTFFKSIDFPTSCYICSWKSFIESATISLEHWAWIESRSWMSWRAANFLILRFYRSVSSFRRGVVP